MNKLKYLRNSIKDISYFTRKILIDRINGIDSKLYKNFLKKEFKQLIQKLAS